MSIIDSAIKKHGAKKVYNAAISYMEGAREALVAVDLGAVNMGDAYEIMMAAHKQMSATEQAQDYWDASKQ